MPCRAVADRNQFDQHQRQKHRKGIVGAGLGFQRRADAGPQPQALRMHQEKHRRRIGRRHHRADQKRLGPVEVEHIAGDGRGDHRGQKHADGRQRHRRRQHRADGLKPASASRHRTGSAPAPPTPPDRWCGHRRSAPGPGPASPASMPISRNTSSSGAPKRSASRLDRMPAMTRTAPRRMAMLTELRDATGPRKQKQILAIASLSSPHFDANPFLRLATMCPVFRPFPLYPDGVAMAPEPRLWKSARYSNQVRSMRRALR